MSPTEDRDMVAKKVIECRSCLRRLSADAAGWVVLRPPGGSPEYLCPGCATQERETGHPPQV